jgi:hypothetical protein
LRISVRVGTCVGVGAAAWPGFVCAALCARSCSAGAVAGVRGALAGGGFCAPTGAGNMHNQNANADNPIRNTDRLITAPLPQFTSTLPKADLE